MGVTQDKTLLPLGSAVLSDCVLLEADALISGQQVPNNRNLLALRTLLEAIVLYENLFILGHRESMKEGLVDLVGCSFIRSLHSQLENAADFRHDAADSEEVKHSVQELWSRLADYYTVRVEVGERLVDSLADKKKGEESDKR